MKLSRLKAVKFGENGHVRSCPLACLDVHNGHQLPPRHVSRYLPSVHRFYSSAVGQAEQGNGHDLRGKKDGRRSGSEHADRDLLISVLSASTTKRDAKAYLSRFRPEDSLSDNLSATRGGPRMALVLFRGLTDLTNDILQGVIRTLTQLTRLGLHLAIIVDPSLVADKSTAQRRVAIIAQADRLVTALQSGKNIRARRLDYVLDLGTGSAAQDSDGQDKVRVEHQGILRDTIKHGTIPVIPAIAYSTSGHHAVEVTPDQVLIALAEEFTHGKEAERDLPLASGSLVPESVQRRCNIDRVIVLDPLGGLVSHTRPDNAHVFVNLQQEYQDIKDELSAHLEQASKRQPSGTNDDSGLAEPTHFTSSNPFSKFLEQEVSPLQSLEPFDNLARAEVKSVTTGGHLKNLELMQQCLSILPPSSSALLTTPLEAATLSSSQALVSTDLGVSTRRPRNPLIFNLLTDKPIVSSSLPASRLRTQQVDVTETLRASPATFFKRGTALSIIPHPREEAWAAPSANRPSMSLDDPRIDFPRLLNLIEDSFNRTLDVEHYMNRVRGKVAGVIVAGDYEGGAILTWELPPGIPDDGSEESARRMVPYLDKFAVLKKSQGSGGVADIVFSAMVRTCFPNGVCWRSRKNNPVNKWYFERSVGTWKLPGTEWSMFWTTPGLFDDKQRLADYEGVCRSILPSWADKKQILD